MSIFSSGVSARQVDFWYKMEATKLFWALWTSQEKRCSKIERVFWISYYDRHRGGISVIGGRNCKAPSHLIYFAFECDEYNNSSLPSLYLIRSWHDETFTQRSQSENHITQSLKRKPLTFIRILTPPSVQTWEKTTVSVKNKKSLQLPRLKSCFFLSFSWNN